jgi:hypothetical protein
MIITILAVIGGLFVAFWVLSAVIGIFGNKVSIGVKNIRYMLKKQGIDPDTLTPEQTRAIARNAYHGALVMKNGRQRYDATTFQKQLAFRVGVVARHLKGEAQHPEFEEFAQILLGEKEDG